MHLSGFIPPPPVPLPVSTNPVEQFCFEHWEVSVSPAPSVEPFDEEVGFPHVILSLGLSRHG